MTASYVTTPSTDEERRVADAIIRAEITQWRSEHPGLLDPAYPAREVARVLLAARAAIAELHAP